MLKAGDDFRKHEIYKNHSEIQCLGMFTYPHVTICQKSSPCCEPKVVFENIVFFTSIFQEIAVAKCIMSNIVFNMNSMTSMNCDTSADICMFSCSEFGKYLLITNY